MVAGGLNVRVWVIAQAPEIGSAIDHYHLHICTFLYLLFSYFRPLCARYTLKRLPNIPGNES